MTSTHLLTQTATMANRTATGARDVFGDPTDVETSSTAKCYLYQTTRTEQTAGADLALEEWRIVLEPDARIGAGDGLTVDGVAFEVYGEPWPVFNPRTRRVDHIEATLRRTS